MYDTVADFLRDKIQDGSDLSIVSAYFTIYAFDKLRDELTSIKGLRFLFGEPSFIHIDPDKTESEAFQLTETGLKLQNYLPQKEVAKACADWIEENVFHRNAALLPQRFPCMLSRHIALRWSAGPVPLAAIDILLRWSKR